MRSTLQLTPRSTAAAGDAAVKELLTLSGSALLKRILDAERPETFIRRLPEEDFFWIVKRIGETDCLPLLELTAREQWGYLLDLEIWDKDRLDADKALAWFNRLGAAAPERLCAGLLMEESLQFSLLLIRKAEVVVKDGDEEADLPEGYFTLDGRFCIRAVRAGDREAGRRRVAPNPGPVQSRSM